MQYPKPVMSLTELTHMGFSRDYLYRMAHRRNQSYCSSFSGKNGSKFLFDTEKFEKERQKLLVK